MKLRVRSFLGVQKADLELLGVVLVAGHNGAGKSSLLESVVGCVLGSPLPRGLPNKREGARALRDGAESGSVSLEYPGGKIRLNYPGAVAEFEGRPATLGTALGIGAVRFMALPPAERARELAARFQMEPTKADLAAWFVENPGSGLEAPTNAEALDTLWADIEQSGWDAVARRIKEHCTKRKGAWEHLTGTKWGATKSATWCPPSLERDEDYDLEAERATLKLARQEVDELAVYEGATQLDRARLTNIADGAPDHMKLVNELVAEAQALTERMEPLLAQREKLHVPDDGTVSGHFCPKCQAPLRIERDERKYLFLKLAPPPPSQAELKRVRTAIMELDVAIGKLGREQEENAAALMRARVALKTAQDAAKELELSALAQTVDPAKLAAARATFATQEQRVEAISVMQRAKAIVADWHANVIVQAALEPEGVRKGVLDRKLSALNVELGELSAKAKLAPVALTEELEATYDRRRYQLLSESERWRVDFVFALLLHRQESAQVLVLDRFDVIQPQSRPGILMLLAKLNINALIAMTAKEPAAVPDLQKAKVGKALWIADGVLGGLAG